MDASAGGGIGSGRQRRVVLLLVCTAFFMGVLDSTSVYAALPSIGEAFGLRPSELQWVATGYTIAIGGLLLLGGRAAELLGRRRVFLAGVATFAAASLACGLATSAEVLIGARAVQGMGAAVMTPAGMSILVTTFTGGAERNRAIGIWGGLGGVGATAGLLLGGPVTDVLGWRWVFLVNVPVCLAVLAAGPVVLRNGPRPARSTFDVAGAATITAGLVALLAAVVAVPDHGWTAGRTLAPAAAAMALGALFVVVESRSSAPLVPLRLFRSRSVVGGNLVVLAAGMAVDGLLLITTLHAQRVLGFSATRFGLVVALMTASSVVGVSMGQRLTTAHGARAVAAGGMALIASACVVLTRVSADEGIAGTLSLGLLVFGPGMGAAFVAAQIAALTGVSDDESGLASGVEETCFAVGTAVGVAIAAATLAARSRPLLEAGVAEVHAQTLAAQRAYAVAAGIALVGLAATAVLPGHRRRARRRSPVGTTTAGCARAGELGASEAPAG